MGEYITHAQAKQRLGRLLTPFWSDQRNYAGFGDSKYYAPTHDEIETFVRSHPLQVNTTFGELFDCDDYAFVLKGAASLYARDTAKLEAGLCFGIAWGSFQWRVEPVHACNWYLSPAGTLEWVEPQDGVFHHLNQCAGQLTLLLV